MGWTTGKWGPISGTGRDFSILQRVGSDAHSLEAIGHFHTGIKLTTHLHVMPMLRVRGAVHLLLPTPSWRSA
jgi:hypothetical protein